MSPVLAIGFFTTSATWEAPLREEKKKLRISELIHGVTSKMDSKDLESGAQ